MRIDNRANCSHLKYPEQLTGCQQVVDYYNLSPQENKICF
jgi:hypothetical protein